MDNSIQNIFKSELLFHKVYREKLITHKAIIVKINITVTHKLLHIDV